MNHDVTHTSSRHGDVEADRSAQAIAVCIQPLRQCTSILKILDCLRIHSFTRLPEDSLNDASAWGLTHSLVCLTSRVQFSLFSSQPSSSGFSLGLTCDKCWNQSTLVIIRFWRTHCVESIRWLTGWQWWPHSTWYTEIKMMYKYIHVWRQMMYK